MNRLSNQLIGIGLLGLATIALLLAPIHARGTTLDGGADVPPFVRDRVELTFGAAGVAS